MAHLPSQSVVVLTIVALNCFTLTDSALLIKRSADKGNIYFETDEIVMNHQPLSPPRKSEPDVGIRFAGPTAIIGASTEAPAKSEDSHKCSNPNERYHVETGRCYETGRVGGPCGHNMVFLSESDNNIYGDCDCKSTKHGVRYVYQVATSQCYATYDQAYCPEKQWLVFDANSNPVCEPRKCGKHPDGVKTLVHFQDKCLVLYSRRPDLCPDPEKQNVGFAVGEVHVNCIHYNDSSDFTIRAGTLQCAPGTKRDIVGKCRVVKNNQE